MTRRRAGEGKSGPTSVLFVPQRFDGRQAGGPARRPGPEYESDQECGTGCKGHRLPCESRMNGGISEPAHDCCDPARSEHTHQDSKQTADSRDCQRFDEELETDIPGPRAGRLPHSDLTRTLAYGGKQDVHDPDSPDQQ